MVDVAVAAVLVAVATLAMATILVVAMATILVAVAMVAVVVRWPRGHSRHHAKAATTATDEPCRCRDWPTMPSQQS